MGPVTHDVNQGTVDSYRHIIAADSVAFYDFRKGSLRMSGTQILPCLYSLGKPVRAKAGQTITGFVLKQEDGQEYWFKALVKEKEEDASMEEMVGLLVGAGCEKVMNIK
jgi:hypothetical protein